MVTCHGLLAIIDLSKCGLAQECRRQLRHSRSERYKRFERSRKIRVFNDFYSLDVFLFSDFQTFHLCNEWKSIIILFHVYMTTRTSRNVQESS